MTDTATEATTRRGRPRPEETITRDQQAIEKIREMGGKTTRNQLKNALGDSVKLSQAYLTLVRLRQQGKVTRTREGTEHVWTLN